jgi:hypothetical protein
LRDKFINVLYQFRITFHAFAVLLLIISSYQMPVATFVQREILLVDRLKNSYYEFKVCKDCMRKLNECKIIVSSQLCVFKTLSNLFIFLARFLFFCCCLLEQQIHFYYSSVHANSAYLAYISRKRYKVIKHMNKNIYVKTSL